VCGCGGVGVCGCGCVGVGVGVWGCGCVGVWVCVCVCVCVCVTLKKHNIHEPPKWSSLASEARACSHVATSLKLHGWVMQYSGQAADLGSCDHICLLLLSSVSSLLGLLQLLLCSSHGISHLGRLTAGDVLLQQAQAVLLHLQLLCQPVIGSRQLTCWQLSHLSCSRLCHRDISWPWLLQCSARSLHRLLHFGWCQLLCTVGNSSIVSTDHWVYLRG